MRTVSSVPFKGASIKWTLSCVRETKRIEYPVRETECKKYRGPSFPESLTSDASFTRLCEAAELNITNTIHMAHTKKFSYAAACLLPRRLVCAPESFPC